MFSCDLHDYLEIACLYHMAVRVHLADGERIEGLASDLGFNSHREECLFVQVRGCADRRDVPLAQLRKMEALKDNPHFTVVAFPHST